MSWPWSELGLDGPADLPAIRRAYAQRLKTTHPEEDPEGFGRLHAAYQEARRQVRPQRPSPTGQASSPPSTGGGEPPWDFDRLLSPGEERPPPVAPEERRETWDFDRLLSQNGDRKPPARPEKPPPVWDYEALILEGEEERARRLIRVNGVERLAGPPVQFKKRGRTPWLAPAVFILLLFAVPCLVSGLGGGSSPPQESRQIRRVVSSERKPARPAFPPGLGGEASDPAASSLGPDALNDMMYLSRALRETFGRQFTVQFAPDGDGYAAVPVDDSGLRFRVRPRYNEWGRPVGIESHYTGMLLCRALRLFAIGHGLDLFYDVDWQDKRGPTLHDLDSPTCYGLSFPLTGGEGLLRALCAAVNELLEEPAFRADPPTVQLRLGRGGLSLELSGGEGLDGERLVEAYSNLAAAS